MAPAKSNHNPNALLPKESTDRSSIDVGRLLPAGGTRVPRIRWDDDLHSVAKPDVSRMKQLDATELMLKLTREEEENVVAVIASCSLKVWCWTNKEADCAHAHHQPWCHASRLSQTRMVDLSWSRCWRIWSYRWLSTVVFHSKLDLSNHPSYINLSARVIDRACPQKKRRHDVLRPCLSGSFCIFAFFEGNF